MRADVVNIFFFFKLCVLPVVITETVQYRLSQHAQRCILLIQLDKTLVYEEE